MLWKATELAEQPGRPRLAKLASQCQPASPSHFQFLCPFRLADRLEPAKRILSGIGTEPGDDSGSAREWMDSEQVAIVSCRRSFDAFWRLDGVNHEPTKRACDESQPTSADGSSSRPCSDVAEMTVRANCRPARGVNLPPGSALHRNSAGRSFDG